jgi:hypothetical protein
MATSSTTMSGRSSVAASRTARPSATAPSVPSPAAAAPVPPTAPQTVAAAGGPQLQETSAVRPAEGDPARLIGAVALAGTGAFLLGVLVLRLRRLRRP